MRREGQVRADEREEVMNTLQKTPGPFPADYTQAVPRLETPALVWPASSSSAPFEDPISMRETITDIMAAKKKMKKKKKRPKLSKLNIYLASHYSF